MDVIEVEESARNTIKATGLTVPDLWLSRLIRWFPVTIVLSVLTWSYITFISQLYHFNMTAQCLVGTIAFQLLFLLTLWTFFATMTTPPGSVKEGQLSDEMVQSLSLAKSENEWKSLLEIFALQLQVNVTERSIQNAIRYCEKCCLIKPDRCHHCSACGKCVLKMDHHCPWVNNCVGFYNYKFFMLFLAYAYVYCVVVANALMNNFLGEADPSLNLTVLSVVVLIFFVFLSSLFWYHMFLILCNRSTLEQSRAPVFENGKKNKFAWNLGRKKNVCQVFGNHPLYWFFPIQTAEGDGMHFKKLYADEEFITTSIVSEKKATQDTYV